MSSSRPMPDVPVNGGTDADLLSVRDDQIPSELKARDQWVAWRFEPRVGGKPAKVPFNPATGKPADATSPASWVRFDDAIKFYRNGDADGVGIGIVFGKDRSLAGLDLDRCRDRNTGILDQWAEELAAQADTYGEVSPSGTGVKLFAAGPLPDGRRRTGAIELYDSRRFFAMTGHKLPGLPATVQSRPEFFADLHARLFGKRPANDEDASGPIQWPPVLPDDEVLRVASTAKNGSKFLRLWAGDWKWGFPSQSEADLSLCRLLAFWVGPDGSRIDSLFRQSGLYRSKWNRSAGRATYGRCTVEKALVSQRCFFSPSLSSPQQLCLNGSHGGVRGALKLALKQHGLPTVPQEQQARLKLLASVCGQLASTDPCQNIFLGQIELSKLFEVSQKTISRDLARLRDQGILLLTKPGDRKTGHAAEYCVMKHDVQPELIL